MMGSYIIFIEKNEDGPKKKWIGKSRLKRKNQQKFEKVLSFSDGWYGLLSFNFVYILLIKVGGKFSSTATWSRPRYAAWI